MATVFIHNAIAIYQFSQQNQTRIDCAIVAGACYENAFSRFFRARLIMPSGLPTHCPVRWY